MKTCNKCYTQVDDQARFCHSCGGSDFVVQDAPVQQYEQEQFYQPTYDYATQVEDVQSVEEDTNSNGNIVAGIVGAFLLSIVGGLLYFIIYQIGFVAGICGLVTFILANFGYGLFAKTKNKASTAGLVTSILVTIVMIYLAEYFCISFEIFTVYKDQGITIFDAIRATPEFLAEAEVGTAVAKDLAFAYIFGGLTCISNVVNLVKERNKKQ